MRKRNKKGEIFRTILSVVAAIGFLGAALVVPNALIAFDKFGLLPNTSKSQRAYYARSIFSKLLKEGLIKLESGPGHTKRARLTKRGAMNLARYDFARMTVTKKTWDGKWRVIVFDIPEQQKRKRETLRGVLRGAGFCFLQRSVWVTPYPCEEMVVLLKAAFALGNSVRCMTVEHIENDKYLRRRFNLAK